MTPDRKTATDLVLILAPVASGFHPVVAANEVGREPVQYVRKIFEYHIAYSRLSEQDVIRRLLMSKGLADD